MVTYEELIKSDGSEFVARIDEISVRGIIAVEDSNIFLLFNDSRRSGGSPRNMRGFRQSWSYGTKGWSSPSVVSLELKITEISKDELLKKNGYKFECLLAGNKCEGEICVDNGKIFFLQDREPGRCPDKGKRGYKHSWEYDSNVSNVILKGVAEKKVSDATFKDLLDKDNYTFTATIKGTTCTGLIRVQAGSVFLCQDKCEGSYCNDLAGFKYSWSVSTGDPKGLEHNGVKDFKIIAGPAKIETNPKFAIDDVIWYGGKTYVVYDRGYDHVYVYDTDFNKSCFSYSNLTSATLVNHLNFHPIYIQAGNYVKVGNLKTYASTKEDILNPLVVIPVGAIVKVTSVRSPEEISRVSLAYFPFTVEYEGKTYGCCQQKSNEFSIVSGPTTTTYSGPLTMDMFDTTLNELKDSVSEGRTMHELGVEKILDEYYAKSKTKATSKLEFKKAKKFNI